MDPETAARLDRLDRHQDRLHEAIEALSAVIEDPESGGHPPRRAALLEALSWLERDATCGDCVQGRCHWGGEQSRAAAAAAAAGDDYVDPDFGRCGCERHGISVQARLRRTRLQTSGLLP